MAIMIAICQNIASVRDNVSINPHLAVWIVLLVLLLGIESISTSLVSIWFALGAGAALIASGITSNWLIQIVVFLVVSSLCLLLVRPLTKKWFHPNASETNIDSLIGKSGVVIEQIDNLNASGQVRVAGQVWSARAKSGSNISVNDTVEVLGIEGVKLIVQKKRQEGE